MQRAPKLIERVSVIAGAWEGQRLADAPRLPVFAVRGSDTETIRVIIEPPLFLPIGGDTDAALAEATRQFGVLIEDYVWRYPVEWRDWKNLSLVA